MKYKAAILANETRDDHILWEEACKMRRDEISYDVINLVSSGWLEKVMAGGYDVLLAKPGGMTGYFKQLYDERALILVNELGYFIYPSLREILLYENKRFLSYWLKANHISHPETFVFCDQDEALAFLDAARFPLVAKYNIGASGSGVFILNNHTEAEGYIEKAFSEEGPPRRWGPA